MVARVYSRTFQKAGDLLGGSKALARRLRVPLADLEKWLAGTAAPPMPVFLQAVDLVLDETAPPSPSEPEEPPSARDCAGYGNSTLMF
jgi:hypothetical protein